MNLYQWAIKWGVSYAALAELNNTYGLNGTEGDSDGDAKGKSEAYAQSVVRLEAARKDIRLWRNNVGALLDETGRPVRYGLANDSKELNATIKSADLIGIRKVTIEPRHVGQIIGQFVSREIKEPGWHFNPNDSHEAAQLRWAHLILMHGGDASFATGEGTL